jgi:hypothetical protein
VVSVLTPAEVQIAARRLAGARPHLAAVAGIAHPEDLWQLCRDEIESINARLRRAVNARGHFPTEQAALKCLYLAIMSLDPTGDASGGRPPSTPSTSPDGRRSAGRK